MSSQILQFLLPLLLIVVIVALRARKLSKKQPLKLGGLWIRPIFLLAACILVLALPQPGVPVRHFATLDWAVLALAGVVGGIGGWYLGRTMAIEVHPEDGTLMAQASPVGAELKVTAEASYVDGRLHRFTVAARHVSDGKVVASGEVTRVVVDAERFLMRL